MNILPLLYLCSQIQMLWQSPLCGLSDRDANKQTPELAVAGTSEMISAEALRTRHGASTPLPNTGLGLNASRTSAEKAAVSFGAQPTAENTIF